MRSFLSIFCAVLVIAGTSYAQDVSSEGQGVVTPVPDIETLPEATEAPAEILPESDDEALQTPDADAPAIDSVISQNGNESDPFTSDELAAMDPAIAAEIESFYLPLDILKMPSLFFTKWERDLLIEARNGAMVRPVVPGDAGSELLSDDGSAAGLNSPREINLSGIAYVSPVSWTIWLNNIRITPTALLPEIMDLTVYKDRIEIEWLDRQTNQIYPIRLRTHEKFNIDTRMFLSADSQ